MQVVKRKADYIEGDKARGNFKQPRLSQLFDYKGFRK
jgi:hypothetical protein